MNGNVMIFIRQLENMIKNYEKYPGFSEVLYFSDEQMQKYKEMEGKGKTENVSVILNDSVSAAVNETKESDKVLLLNFANHFSKGGGVRRGAQAQEEDICRSSTLYGSLINDKAEPYYNIPIKKREDEYLGDDAVLISPKVYVPTGECFSVLTSAAPYFDERIHADYQNIFEERIDAFLSLAEARGYETLVLGAYGCGAFGNDPEMVANAFKKGLKKYRFKKVVFAIKENRTGISLNYMTFKNVFDNQ